jgi:hypothetical protein
MRGSSVLRQAPVWLLISAVILDAASSQVCFSHIPLCHEGNPVSLVLFSRLGGMWPTAFWQSLVFLIISLPLWYRRLWIGGAVGWILWAGVLLVALHRMTVVFDNSVGILTHLP